MSNSKKRILILGDARQVHIARWVDYFEAEGCLVFVVSLESTDDFDFPAERIEISDQLPDFARYPLAVRKVQAIIREFEPDLINAHFVPNYGVIATMCGFHPWVMSTWGSDIMLLPQRSVFHKQRTRWVLSKADAITSDADIMSERIRGLGVADERIVTFPYGVDRRVFFPRGDYWSKSGPRILSNRKLEPLYNVGRIIQSFARQKKVRLPEASLTIAGDGELRDKLHTAAFATGYSHSVEFTGNLPHSKVAEQLRHHDIYVSVPDSDTTSVSLLEAMACGLFPVVSDIPANREWIEHGKNGILVDMEEKGALEDAIANAWNDEALRARAVTANGIIIRERADWFDNMKVVRELFESLW